MPLELSTVTTVTTTKAPKAIMVFQSSSSATMYEVPEGREFEGVLGSASYQYFPTINGQGNHAWAGNASSAVPVPATLPAGTIVGGSPSTTTWIMGIERDA